MKKKYNKFFLERRVTYVIMGGIIDHIFMGGEVYLVFMGGRV